MGVGTVEKNLSEKTRRMSGGCKAREPSMSRRGGIRLARQPCRQAVARQSLSGEVWCSLSFAQARLASCTIFRSSLPAEVRSPCGVEQTSARAASQCAFHHLTPRKSGV